MDETEEMVSRCSREILKCRKNPAYFLDTYVKIFDARAGDWLPFHLWRAQEDTLREIDALGRALFHPAATILLFSRRDDEAVDLLKTRLRGMYDRLPDWMKVRYFKVDNDHEWHLSNGSCFLALPTTGR